MNIRTLGFVIIVAYLMSGCAGSTDTDSQKIVQATDPVQEAATVESTDTDQQMAAAQAADDGSYDPDKTTCKKIKKVGSRLFSKVCATNQEWEDSAARAKETTEKYQRRPQTREGN